MGVEVTARPSPHGPVAVAARVEHAADLMLLGLDVDQMCLVLGVSRHTVARYLARARAQGLLRRGVL